MSQRGEMKMWKAKEETSLENSLSCVRGGGFILTMHDCGDL
jgi:hypothetical protein